MDVITKVVVFGYISVIAIFVLHIATYKVIIGKLDEIYTLLKESGKV